VKIWIGVDESMYYKLYLPIRIKDKLVFYIIFLQINIIIIINYNNNNNNKRLMFYKDNLKIQSRISHVILPHQT